MECIRPRVKDTDFEINEVRVHSGKGDRDRLVPLPESIKPALETHIERVKLMHENDLSKGYGEVYLPQALSRKYPNSGREWCKQARIYELSRVFWVMKMSPGP